MDRLNEAANTYASYHQTKINQIFHIIGIPLIIISLIIALNWFKLSFLHHGEVPFSWVLLIILTAYYITLGQPKVAVVMFVLYAILDFIVMGIGLLLTFKFQLIAALLLFFIGWILNFIGHSIEKRKPAFLHNLLQTLIAPIFITDEIMQMFGMHLYTKQTSNETTK